MRAPAVLVSVLIACSGDAGHSVAAIGDSITSGGTPGVSAPWPARLGSLLGSPWTVDNYGFNGKTATYAAERWARDIRAKRHGSVVVFAGINDLKFDATPDEVFASLRSIYDSARSDGCRVVAVTLLPWRGYRSWTAEREARRVEVNARIREYCRTGGIVCIDAATEMDDGTGALRIMYDSGDHHHPNQTGQDRLAALIRAGFH